MSSTSPPPPGWYRNPDDLSEVRFWDGTRWTEHLWEGPSERSARGRSDSGESTDADRPPSAQRRLSYSEAYRRCWLGCFMWVGFVAAPATFVYRLALQNWRLSSGSGGLALIEGVGIGLAVNFVIDGLVFGSLVALGVAAFWRSADDTELRMWPQVQERPEQSRPLTEAEIKRNRDRYLGDDLE